MLRDLAFGAVLVAGVSLTAHAQSDFQWSFGSNGTSDYTMETASAGLVFTGGLGSPDPTITLIEGMRYEVTVINSITHPFQVLAKGGTAAQEPSAERPGISQVPAETMGVVTRAVQRDLSSAVGKCLDALTQDKRDVLVLRLMEHRSNQEIAKLLGIPANTVAVRYRRALDELRNGLPADVFDDIASAAP